MMPTTKMKASPMVKLRSLKMCRIDERLLHREGLDDEQVEGERRHHRLDHDLGRGEPVELLAAVEHHLERADGDVSMAKPNQSKLPLVILVSLR